MDLLTIGQIVNTTLVLATAFIFASLGGVFCEKSGIANLGIEGLMIFGAFGAATGTYYAEQAGMGNMTAAWIGIACALILGTLVSLIHALATITFKADQIISGIVVNFLAAGTTLYIVRMLFNGAAETELIQGLSKVCVPGLTEIPLIGEVFFHCYPTTYLAFLFVGVGYYILYKTPFGLRLMAVGECPSAADTLGAKVNRIRYIAVMTSGGLAGLGGAVITLTTSPIFSHSTICGQGYIAIAAMIFGKWHPVGACFASIFFALTQAVQNYFKLFTWSQNVPQELLFMLPYVVTIIVLVLVVGRSNAPAALGQPYELGKR